MLSSAGASLAELSPEILSDGGEERSRGAAPAILVLILICSESAKSG